jgi:hypothetical protein
MATELAPVSTSSCTLYDLEYSLVLLAATLEDDPGAADGILEEIGAALRETKAKRDRVVAFLRHCEQQIRFADQEIERLGRRQRRIAVVQNALEQYVIGVIDRFVAPDRRGVKRLEGNVSSLRIQKNPDSVAIVDDGAVPLAYKDVVLTMPAYVWEAILQRLSKDERVEFERSLKRREFRAHKNALARELKLGAVVPGAELTPGSFRLVIS